MPKFAQDPRFLIAFAMLLFLAVVGMSILIWLAPIPDAEVTAGQQGLREIGDWIVKSSIGAIMDSRWRKYPSSVATNIRTPHSRPYTS